MSINKNRLQRLLGDAELDPQILTILEEVYAYFCANLDWPKAKYFHVAMWKKQIDITKVIPGAEQLVRGYDTNSNETKTVPTFAGLALVHEAEHDLENLLNVLRYAGALYAENPDRNLVPVVAVGDKVNVLREDLRRLVMIGPLGSSPLWVSNGPDLDKAHFQVQAGHLNYADVQSVDELLDRLFPNGLKLYPASEGWLFGRPEEPDIIEWLIRTLPHFQWASVATLTHHLSAANEHATATPPRWDDCSSQLRKVLEQLIANYTDAIAARLQAPISPKQPKPTVAERVHFLRDRHVITPNEDSLFYAVYGWLSAKGAHPGIPTDVEGRAKYVVTCQALKLFVTAALNTGLPAPKTP
jgi:hypothetical protein